MTAHDNEIARKITGYLDVAAQELRSGTAYRLQQARAAAIARLQEPQRAPELRLSGVGGSMAGPRPFYGQFRFWIGVALIAFAAFGWQQWQEYSTIQEAEEIDAQLLMSDLPIDAYLDRGFQTWLRNVSEQ